MIAGRELDALIAEKVMGLMEFSAHAGPHKASMGWGKPGDTVLQLIQLPNYSTDIAAAWTIVKFIDAWGLANEFKLGQDYEGLWNCIFKGTRKGKPFRGEDYNGDTAPHAICLAALKVIGHQL